MKKAKTTGHARSTPLRTAVLLPTATALALSLTVPSTTAAEQRRRDGTANYQAVQFLNQDQSAQVSFTGEVSWSATGENTDAAHNTDTPHFKYTVEGTLAMECTPGAAPTIGWLDHSGDTVSWEVSDPVACGEQVSVVASGPVGPGGTVRLRLSGRPHPPAQNPSDTQGFQQVPTSDEAVTTGNITEFAVS
ncbi:hypothetical protein [Streptomyces luteireticuli]|uniref:hypothetical protein n=1 Tax=Streptomyces luteireticuli TaxID=173858 RepID=UPI0035569332